MKSPAEEEEETFARIRYLLKCVSSKGKTVGRAPSMRASERWRQPFSKIDIQCTGSLSFKQMRAMIRRGYKLGERLVPDTVLHDLFDAIDADRSGTIEMDEWLAFVQKARVTARPEEAVLKQVGRAVRLSFRRNNLFFANAEAMFQSFQKEIAPSPEIVDIPQRDVVRFFREVLRVSKHECSDSNVLIAFKLINTDKSNTLSLSEFKAWIRCIDEAEIDYFGYTPSTNPQRRCSTRSLASPEAGYNTVPFSLEGRGCPPRSRLAVAAGHWGVQASTSLPEIKSSTCGTMTAWGTPPSSPATGNLQRSLSSGGLSGEIELNRPGSSSGALARPNSMPALSPSAGSYCGMKGSRTLNRVELRLFESGVDVRGQYYKRT
mmetsp:Transcript_24526/g.54588  ORF Transcript_24526/g.54588 Transcript_24526/m.54588 type:complete len:376 (-) Transcript_24526:259-1386(-)